MTRVRHPAPLVAVLAAVASCAAPAAAQTSGDARSREAITHARTLEQAFYTLDRHIRREATEATTWTGDIPPALTGWQTGWTARGLRAQYCGGTLLVYFEPAQLKGVGANHRAVQTAPTAAARGEGGVARPLQWLESGVARGGGGRPTVTPPACMDGLPSGRPALAAAVRDPWTVTRTTTRWQTRDIMECPAGHHRPPRLAATDPAGRERRQVSQAVVAGKRDAQTGEPVTSGDPTYGEWEAMWSHCVEDFSTTVTETRPCTFPLPAGGSLSGREFWTGTRTRSADPDNRLLTITSTSWEDGPTSTTCRGELAAMELPDRSTTPPAPTLGPERPQDTLQPTRTWREEQVSTLTGSAPCLPHQTRRARIMRTRTRVWLYALWPGRPSIEAARRAHGSSSPTFYTPLTTRSILSETLSAPSPPDCAPPAPTPIDRETTTETETRPSGQYRRAMCPRPPLSYDPPTYGQRQIQSVRTLTKTGVAWNVHWVKRGPHSLAREEATWHRHLRAIRNAHRPHPVPSAMPSPPPPGRPFMEEGGPSGVTAAAQGRYTFTRAEGEWSLGRVFGPCVRPSSSGSGGGYDYGGDSDTPYDPADDPGAGDEDGGGGWGSDDGDFGDEGGGFF